MHTEHLIVNILIFALGVAILIKGSDWFIDGASYIARKFNVPEIVIGLTLVSLGTSLPELATNVYASLNGEGCIAIGNVVGSNITNVLLVLGAGIVLTRNIDIPKALLKRDGFFMLGASLLCAGMYALGGGLGRIDGVILLIIVLYYLYILLKHKDSLEAELPDKDEPEAFKGIRGALVFSALGLIMIFAGAQMLVDNVVWTAEKLNWNKAVISATIVALGTSLPELAVTIAGVIKKKHGIALGNIVGSNIFNILLILGISCVISPIGLEKEMLYVNLPIMVTSSALLLIFMRTSWKLVRAEGVILLLLYCLFIGYNVMKLKF
ncbi:MAG: calcium/sodium antiporter [Victivallales bacterium]|nr:calcium/sodium antiporter [Victivallales bacterium]